MAASKDRERQAARLLHETEDLWRAKDVAGGVERALSARALLGADGDRELRFACELTLVQFYRHARDDAAVPAALRLVQIARTGLAAPLRFQADTLLAATLLDSGRYAEAAPIWPAPPAGPTDHATFAAWAAAGIELGRSEDVRSALGALGNGPRTPDQLSELALLDARALQSLGELATARAAFQRILRRWPNVSWQRRVACLEALGSIALVLGEYRTALDRYGEALRFLDGSPAAVRWRAEIQLRRGLLHVGPLRRHDLGLPMLEEGVRLGPAHSRHLTDAAQAVLVSRQRGSPHREAAPTSAPEAEPEHRRPLRLVADAKVQAESGAIDRSLTLVREAARQAEQHPNPVLRAESALLLGRCLLAQGHPDAERWVTGAAALARDHDLKDILAEAHIYLARIRFAVGDRAQALELARESSRLIDAARADLPHGSYRRAYGRGLVDRFEELASLHAEKNPLAAFELVEHSLSELGERPVNDTDRSARRANRATSARLLTIVRERARGPGRSTDASASAEARRLLAEREPPTRAARSQGARLQSVLARIPSRVLFVTLLGARFETLLLWVTTDARAGCVRLGPQSDRVRRVADDWKRAVSAMRDHLNDAGSALWAPGRLVYDALFEPISAIVQFDALDQLVIVPGRDPIWQGFPFHALPTDEETSLGARVLVTYAPSVNAYSDCRRAARWRSLRRNRIDGVYAAAREDKPGTGENRRRAIADLDGHFPSRAWEGTAVEDVAERWERATIPMFLGHCRPDPEVPALSMLVLRNGEPLPAFELADIPFRRAKLFVLAACAGLHDVPGSADEGTGPSAALLRAGIPSVLSCGWPVAEEVAIAFLHAFFAALRTQPIGAAYALAQAALRQKYPDPHAWAVFFLNGSELDPGPLPMLRRWAGRFAVRRRKEQGHDRSGRC